MSCWQFSMTHCHHCICIIVLYQVLVRNIISIKQPPAWKLSQQMFLLVLSILNHLTELLELITKCSHLIFYWPLTNVHLLLTTIIDTIYLDKLFLIDNLKGSMSMSQISVLVDNKKKVIAHFIFIKVLHLFLKSYNCDKLRNGLS